MRGRKPTPTARRQLEGNPGKRPYNDREPVLPAPDAGTFDVAPKELARDRIARAEWRRLAPMLRRTRVVTQGDKTALVALCHQWSRYLEASREVARLGMVVKTPNGYPIPNPYLNISNRALSQCLKLWVELGLTPSSRSRISAGSEEPASDPFSEFDEPSRRAPSFYDESDPH